MSDYLHDMQKVAKTVVRINYNLSEIKKEMALLEQQIDMIHKDVFHHLPVSKFHGRKQEDSSE